MKKTLALLAALLLPFTAAAHGPTPMKTVESVTIKCVITVIKNIGHRAINDGVRPKYAFGPNFLGT